MAGAGLRRLLLVGFGSGPQRPRKPTIGGGRESLSPFGSRWLFGFLALRETAFRVSQPALLGARISTCDFVLLLCGEVGHGLESDLPAGRFWGRV